MFFNLDVSVNFLGSFYPFFLFRWLIIYFLLLWKVLSLLMSAVECSSRVSLIVLGPATPVSVSGVGLSLIFLYSRVSPLSHFESSVWLISCSFQLSFRLSFRRFNSFVCQFV